MSKPASTLVIDSREQLPLEFREGIFDKVEVGALAFGDYGLFINEVQVPIVFERKGLGDLFGTMGQGYERFKREMIRANEMHTHMVLAIEGNEMDVWKGYEHSTISGDTMLKKLAMLRVRHDLEILFFNNRREMARWIEEVFSAIVRNFTLLPVLEKDKGSVKIG
jgi:ERCC4-type nuclease